MVTYNMPTVVAGGPLRQAFEEALRELFPRGWFGYRIVAEEDKDRDCLIFGVHNPLDEPLLEGAEIYDEVDAVLAAGQVKEAILNHTTHLLEKASTPSSFVLGNVLKMLRLLLNLGFSKSALKELLLARMMLWKWKGDTSEVFVSLVQRADNGQVDLQGQVSLVRIRRSGPYTDHLADTVQWSVWLDAEGKIHSGTGRVENGWGPMKGRAALTALAGRLVEWT